MAQAEPDEDTSYAVSVDGSTTDGVGSVSADLTPKPKRATRSKTKSAIKLDSTPPTEFALNCSVKSDTIGEILIGISEMIRKHEKDIEGHDIFPRGMNMKITPRGQKTELTATEKKTNGREIKFETASREVKYLLQRLISLSYCEIYVSIIHLYTRLIDVFDLLTFTEEFRVVVMANDDRFEEYLYHWVKRYKAFVIRHSIEADDFFIRESHESLKQVQNKTRILNGLDIVSANLRKISAVSNPAPKLTLLSANDVILMKQEDFEYPFGASFFELMIVVRECGYGINQIRNISKDHRKGNIIDMFKSFKTEIASNFKDEIYENVKNFCGDRHIGLIVITNDFIEDVSDVIANFMFAIGVSAYNYSKAHTDYISTTTIQLRALKSILLNIVPGAYTSLTPSQIECLSVLTLRFIEMIQEKIQHI